MSTPAKFGEPSMILVSSFYGEHNSFKMIPTTELCPYVECIYDPSIQFLVVIGRNKKNGFHMTERLDENGAKIPVKNFNPQMHQHQFKRERKIIETYQEYYIIKEDEQIAFIENFAANVKDYDYKQYMDKPDLPDKASDIIGGENKGILDEKGNPVIKKEIAKEGKK